MTEIAHIVSDFCDTHRIPGFLAGLHHRGERTVLAHGVANLTTGAPMRADTGFLFGSITKIMTTTLVLQQVERGLIDLDTPVVAYLPEFRLTTPGAAERITVRHLITATSGIDADLFFPDDPGPDALRTYVDRLGRECGALFEAGAYVSYSNGGMIVAGRLLEVVTGLPYDELLARDVFAPAGMTDACTSAERAILRSTAIGHVADPETGEVRPTGMFMLPRTWGPAGGTPIGTIDDLLAFGRAHLDTADGRLLSAASVARMREVAHDMATPGIARVGLGWLVERRAGVTMLTMTGASPGGVAVLAVVPERELVFAAYGNDARALELHDALLRRLVGDPEPATLAPGPAELTPYAGTYRSDQLRIDVRAVDGALEETVTYAPADASQERIFTGFLGGPFAAPPTRYVPVGPGLFAPEGLPVAELPPYYLVSYHGDGAYRSSGGRMARRV